MKKYLSILLITIFISANCQDLYFPSKGNWEAKLPSDFNYNSDNYIDQLTILFAKNLEDKYVNLRKIVIQWNKITPYLKISKK